MGELFYYLNLYFWILIILGIILFIANECRSSEKFIIGVRCISIAIIIVTLCSLTFDISSEINSCIKKRDFEYAHKWLERMKVHDSLSGEPEYEHSLLSIITLDSFLYEITGISLFGDYFFEEKTYSASEYLIKKHELLDAETSYLLNLGDEESLNRIISVMYNFTLDYSPHLGNFDSYNKKRYEYKINQRCVDEAMRYNRKCDILLNKAINVKNLEFAKAIIPLYKDNLIIKEIDYSLFGDNTYNISLSKDDKNNAQNKLNEAIKEGIFEGI